MKRHFLTSVAVIALALGMTAAGAQSVDQRRNTDQGRPTDQVERNQQPRTPGQSQNMPSQQQRSDQDNRQGPQNQQGTQNQQEPSQQNAPSTTGQNGTDRQQGDRQPGQGLNQGAQQQNAPATNGPSQQGPQQGQNNREPQQGQNQQQPRQGQNDRQPQQGQNQNQDQPQQGQNQRQGPQEQDAKNDQPDKSGRIALDVRDRTLVSDIIRQQRIQPVTNINFSLSVGSSVPSSVRLSRISGELADIFPDYRDFSFFIAKEELVIVDSRSYDIVAFVPISGGGTVGMAPPRDETDAAAPPAPAKKKAVRPEKKRLTGTEKPRVIKRETVRRRPTHTESDVTVGSSRRDVDEFDRLPPRDRAIGPPVRERLEHEQRPPFPLPLPFLGSPN